MIMVKLMGGLGNQMFQYATARRLAAKHGADLKLDITGYDNMAAEDTPRQYELDVFSITGNVASAADRARVKPVDYRRSFLEKAAHGLGVGDNVYQYHEQGAGFDDRVLSLHDNTYLVGWWQNKNYFNDIRHIILREFTPTNKPTGNNAKYLKLARSSTSVSVHVRRGDYVSNKNARVFHGLAPIDYYNQAAAYMKERMPEAHFFVFSDDLKWCKQNLKLGKRVTFVEGNGGSKAYEDLRIMSACQHNIIANSSFSWWGAWLNDNPDKLVIAPKAWFQDEKANAETDIVPLDWIRL